MLLVSAGIIIVLPLVFNIMNGRESMVDVLLVPRMVGVVIISIKGGKDSVFMEILDVPILHCVPGVA